MPNVYFKEIFEYPIKEFKNHLEDSSNERIIFSGKYGIGKTTFLNDFFRDENQKEILSSIKYNVYKISPINYSISSNDDIIRYIKFDIIIELLRKAKSVKEIDLKFIDTLPLFVKNNLHKIAAALIYMTPKIGKDVVDIFERIDKLKEEFLKFHDEAEQFAGDKMISYLEQLETKEGSIYENDLITKLITDTIATGETQTVLIVEDIDRLDPEHVFRILNVFASHFESTSDPNKRNKFNFDKVIIVCDLNNVRNIFHHRYGIEADFIGYIDKFYSSDVYFFDNKRAIKRVITTILRSIRFNTDNESEKNILRELYLKDDFVLGILKLLLDRNLISLRSIIKMYAKKLEYAYEKICFVENRTEIISWKVPIAMQIKYLKDFLGDYNNMRKVLSRCLSQNEQCEGYDHYFSLLIYLVSAETHNFLRDETYYFKYKEKELVIEPHHDFNNGTLKYVQVYNLIDRSPKGNLVKGDLFHPTTHLFWELLLEAVQMLYQIGYLK